MLATGELLGPPHPVVDELVREARDWLARPLALAPTQLTAQRYAIVDTIDDARDTIDADPAAAHPLLASAVSHIVAHAFLSRGLFQPRRKQAALDSVAAELVRRWATQAGPGELATVAALARHVVAADTFFDWTSDLDPVAVT